MKAVYAKILHDKANQVYATKLVDEPYFSTDFHFHEECQLVYTLQSEGTRMIGDSIENYQSDELIFVGANVPQVWHNGVLGNAGDSENAKSVSVFINPEKVMAFFYREENIQRLRQWFHLAKRGIKYQEPIRSQIKPIMLRMANETDEIKRLSCLLDIMEKLSCCDSHSLLASVNYTHSFQSKDNNRIDQVIKYVFDNFSKEIELNAVANLVNMNKQAFCRFFKNRTQKTFGTFVNEVRIGHACQMLSEGVESISSLAFESGFNNLSNFNKFFKQVKGLTPRAYRNMLKAVDQHA